MIDKDDNIYPDKLPFWERIRIYWDFKSQIKHIWLTGYLIITWEYDKDWPWLFWETLDIGFYKGGSYE